MGFGFDAIDKQFQPKKSTTILLECVDCQSTDDVKTHNIGGNDTALCPKCALLYQWIDPGDG